MGYVPPQFDHLGHPVHRKKWPCSCSVGKPSFPLCVTIHVIHIAPPKQGKHKVTSIASAGMKHTSWSSPIAFVCVPWPSADRGVNGSNHVLKGSRLARESFSRQHLQATSQLAYSLALTLFTLSNNMLPGHKTRVLSLPQHSAFHQQGYPPRFSARV